MGEPVNGHRIAAQDIQNGLAQSGDENGAGDRQSYSRSIGGAYALPPTALSNDTNTWPEGLGAPSVPNVLNTAMPGLDSEALFVDVVAGLAVVGKSHRLSDCCGLG